MSHRHHWSKANEVRARRALGDDENTAWWFFFAEHFDAPAFHGA